MFEFCKFVFFNEDCFVVDCFKYILYAYNVSGFDFIFILKECVEILC